MAVIDEVTQIEDANRPGDTHSELGPDKHVNPDDNVLLAQGHRPILKRTFNFFGSLGLGFRY